ncbi:MAG: PhoH family protein [Deltaproteobacteria bacterium]|nr:MAG: PhoH family protein [Deltaproteobacteria bacterium]
MEQINGETSCLQFDNHRFFHDLLGHQDEHLHGIEKALGVKISAAGTSLIIAGDKDQRALAGRVATQLYGLLQGGYPVYPSDVDYAIRILSRDHSANLRDIFLDTVYISAHRRTITPKSIAQKAYIDAIRRFDIVFGIGPAGTGKTYLAMAVALAELMKHKVSRVVLTRPAVEAGEKLGFLPGDLAEKINPYLRPLYDALHDMVDFDRASKMIERGTIEVAPLAFMRGRTLNDSFVILDEAQNTTSEQMKMFLTRLGYGSKAVITGDITQIDLPAGTRSGLKEAHQILQHIDGIKFIFFSEKDVVRHRLVQDVITAYERAQEEKERAEQERKALRRSRAQARYDDRGLWQGARGEPDRATAVGPDGSAAPEPDAGRTQPGPGDGPRDPRPEPPVSGEGQTD